MPPNYILNKKNSKCEQIQTPKCKSYFENERQKNCGKKKYHTAMCMG